MKRARSDRRSDAVVRDDNGAEAFMGMAAGAVLRVSTPFSTCWGSAASRECLRSLPRCLRCQQTQRPSLVPVSRAQFFVHRDNPACFGSWAAMEHKPCCIALSASSLYMQTAAASRRAEIFRRRKPLASHAETGADCHCAFTMQNPDFLHQHDAG